MCFVFIWEQTATCATYSINWLVFINEMISIYCAVRTGSLNKAVCASYLKRWARYLYRDTAVRSSNQCWSVNATLYSVFFFTLSHKQQDFRGKKGNITRMLRFSTQLLNKAMNHWKYFIHWFYPLIHWNTIENPSLLDRCVVLNG